jgi:tRNA pseudouridine38-40 synthase
VVTGQVVSPFWVRYALQEARLLDLERMRDSAQLFLGTHDWTAFSSIQSDTENKIRTVKGLSIEEVMDHRTNSRIIEMTITANGFLRYMVRSIAGTLLAVGRGEMDAALVKRLIDEGDRSLVAATAPACGLTLVSVRYESDKQTEQASVLSVPPA